MAERLLGMETEYGLSVILKNPNAAHDCDFAAENLVCLAKAIPHLPARRSSGLFLGNGSRFYVDCGAHPEMATPECANPWDVCRYLQAGDRMLVDLAGQLTRREPRVAQTLVLKSNVDYATRSTWACHESYLHEPLSQRVLSRQIIPHLVSRIIFTGGGGFDCFSPGIDFMISPRVAHLRNAVSGNSTGSRGIFHTKNEPLCGNGHHRLHVLSGESLSSETGSWLKVATTALVVALIEAGKQPGDKVEFRDPVAAMRAFASDSTCSRAIKLVDGREATALDVQYEFLRHAEACADADFMPSWGGEVCRQWRAMLDRLRQGHAAVGRTLDWAVKLALFQNRARQHHTTLEALAKWTPVLMKRSLALQGTDLEGEPLTAALMLGRRSPVAEVRQSLTPMLRELGLEWDGLEAMLALRLELFEIDTRYSLLGEGGVFASLDAAGVLDHHFPGVDNVQHALENPPSVGRAAIRGRVIRRVAGRNGRFAAEWDGVWDMEANRRLNLADPFCTSEEWVESRSPDEERNVPQLFCEGRYADLLEQLALMPGLCGCNEDIVLTYARLGRPAEAIAALESLAGRLNEMRHLALKIWIHCSGWVPDADAVAPLLPLADRLMEGTDLSDDYSGFVILACKGLFLMHKGCHTPAEALFDALLGDASNARRSRMYARTRCFMAELHRRLGRRDAALELVNAAARTHRAESLLGDFATHSLPMLAKLEQDDGQAILFLDQAESIHRMQRNELGLAHVLSIRARRLHDSRHRHAIERLQRTVPALTNCEVARRIVSDWDSWVTPGLAIEHMDYWGL